MSAAIRQESRIDAEQEGWKNLQEYRKGELLNVFGRFLDAVQNSRSILHGADCEIDELMKKLVSLAKKEASNDPSKEDLVFADVNGRLAIAKDGHTNQNASKKRKVSTTEEATHGEEDSSLRAILFEMKKGLRDHVYRINALGKELCGRVRSFRYVENIRRIQQQGKDEIKCCSCKGEATGGILSICGHMGCFACLKKNAANGNCIEAPSCKARVSMAHVVPIGQLGVDAGDHEVDNEDGSKLCAMMKKIKEIIAKGDRMIIFVQFDDLLTRIAETLARNSIKAVQVKGRVEEQVKALLPFQKPEAQKGDPFIILLKMDNEQSSGLNLTNLNHVLFVHPLLAGSQQEYDAYETQAIGRVRRYGQLKTVYVWRFLVKDSIDTDIYGQRGGRLLSATTVNEM